MLYNINNKNVLCIVLTINIGAGCINKECKEKATKITKGELRFAVQVTIKDHQSWQYKHWYDILPGH